ncbi:MAG: metallophosphoesterase family protein [Chthoniobacterales bacterium]
MVPKSLRIFVLADTHDHLPENLEALADDVDEIWHLGDLCAPSLLVRLEGVGPPVTLVRGNCDTNSEWPLIVDLERNGVRCRLVHIPPARPPENVDVLLHGHTHVPREERQNGVLFLNPGCVTRPDKGAPPSIATLEITADGKVLWRVTRLR